MASNQNSPAKIKMVGIASYLNVFEPRAFGNNDPKYSVCMLISKKDTKQVAEIRAAIQAAREIGAEKGWKGKDMPDSRLTLPLHDGDLEKPDDSNYQGRYYINCSNTLKPDVVDQSVRPILNPEQIYSGCIVKASVEFFAFNKQGNVGIAASLQNIQLVADGKRLGGKAPATADFEPLSEDEIIEVEKFLNSGDLPDYFN